MVYYRRNGVPVNTRGNRTRAWGNKRATGGAQRVILSVKNTILAVDRAVCTVTGSPAMTPGGRDTGGDHSSRDQDAGDPGNGVQYIRQP